MEDFAIATDDSANRIRLAPDAHSHQRPWDVGDANSMSFDETEHQLEIAGDPVEGIEAAEFLKQEPPTEERGMWGHPPVVEIARPVFACFPVSQHSANIVAGNIDTVSVCRIVLSPLDGRDDVRDDVIIGVYVVGIEKTDHLPRRQADALVHRIVDALVGLRDDRVDAIPVLGEDIDRSIGGLAINDDMLEIAVGLAHDTADRILNRVDIVETDCNDRDFHEFVLKLFRAGGLLRITSGTPAFYEDAGTSLGEVSGENPVAEPEERKGPEEKPRDRYVVIAAESGDFEMGRTTVALDR